MSNAVNHCLQVHEINNFLCWTKNKNLFSSGDIIGKKGGILIIYQSIFWHKMFFLRSSNRLNLPSPSQMTGQSFPMLNNS